MVPYLLSCISFVGMKGSVYAVTDADDARRGSEVVLGGNAWLQGAVMLAVLLPSPLLL